MLAVTPLRVERTGEEQLYYLLTVSGGAALCVVCRAYRRAADKEFGPFGARVSSGHGHPGI